MVKTKHTDTVSIILIRTLLKYVSKDGIDPLEICKTSGIDYSVTTNSEARISGTQFQSIWKEAMERTENHNFGLHFGKEMALNYPGGNILFNVMMNCPTVRDAMERFVRYNNLMADAIQPKMKLEGDNVYLSLDTQNQDFKIPRHISEALLSSYVHIFRNLTEDNLDLVEVRFKHPHPQDLSEHDRIFKAPVSFGQRDNELVIHRKCLDLPILLANSELLKTLEKFAKKLLGRLYLSNTWSDSVVRLLSNVLVRGEKPGIDKIAKDLAMSVRNLQIKLREEGTTYQNLLDEVRKEIALSYLKEKGVTMCDIAFLLGFSEQSAFNHAFKRWTGSTPREYSK